MPEGLAAATANAILDCYFRGTNITAPTNTYIQLHTGAPGSAGTSNVATESTRKLITSSMAAASGGSIASNADVNWTSVAGSETYTKCSLWTASSGGTFLASGSVTASAVTAGDNFSILSGNLTGSLTTAS